MDYVYYATFTADPDGGFVVTFADVPEAITHGFTHGEALSSASEALGLALRGYLLEEKPLPQPVEKTGIAVAVHPTDAAKLAVITRFRALGISKTELAKRLGKAEGEARRILDPDYPSKINMLTDALAAMGQTIVVSVLEDA